MTKFSVVIPLYNKAPHITRAINSVLNQTCQDFEIIVVDDGSMDGGGDLVAEMHDTRIRLIHQENAGVSAARNKGVYEATHDLIAFLDADDEWYSEFLESIMRLKTQFPDADVFGSSYYILDKEGTLRLPSPSTLFRENWQGIITNYLETRINENPFYSSSVAVHKQALEKIGGFPIGVHNGEDVDTWIRLSLKSKIAFINKPLSIYHQEAENRACVLYSKHIQLDVSYWVKELVQFLHSGEIPESQRQSAIETIANSYLPIAQTHLYYGNNKKAIEFILSCRGTRKHIIKKYWLLFCAYLPPVLLSSLIKIKHNVLNPLFHKRYEK